MDEHDRDLGRRVRAARNRLGWSREALAFHSGVSWAGVSQVESGRRREARSSTLAALATALGVTIDYLVLGKPGATMFDHRLSVYGSDEELVTEASSWLSPAPAPSEAVLVVVSPRNIALLRRQVGSEARKVRFADSSKWYSTPAAALRAYEEFCTTSVEQGAVWVRIIAEVSWMGRPGASPRPWIRLDSLLNLVLAQRPVSMLCLCDKSSLRGRLERQLREVHPEPTGHELGENRYAEQSAFLL